MLHCMAYGAGTIRDDQGQWNLGFVRRVNTTDVLNAKLWAILWGLVFCKLLSLKDVELASDSQAAIRMLG